MPDEITPGSAGQGGVEAPGEPGQGFDYEHAYSELRPEYTRATQEASQYRERAASYEALFDGLRDPDPEVRAAAMDALGLEYVEDGPQGAPSAEDEFVDPLEEEVKELRAWREEVQRAREEEAEERENQSLIEARDTYIGEAVSLIEQALSTEAHPFEFTPQEDEVLGNLAIQMTGDDGVPDVRGAYNALYGDQGVAEIHWNRRVDRKQGAAQAPLGTSIPAEKRPRTAQDRIAYADQRWADIANQQ